MNKIKRPLVTILIGVLIGIVYGLYFKTSIAFTISIISLLFFIIFYFRAKKRLIYFLIRKKQLILMILISAIISNIYLNLTNNQYEKVYKVTPQNIQATAQIISDAEETEYYYVYNVKISNKKFILYINKNKEVELEYGMKIALTGEYSEPEGTRNYKGFSYKDYLKTKKIYGTIKVDGVQILKKTDVNYILRCSNRLRNKIIETIKQIIPKNTRGLLQGILIGETSEISDEIEENFRNSSLSHIVAISGSHITYIIVGISYLLVKSRISKRLTYIITIISLMVFMLITNFSASVVRACIMGITMLLSKVLYRKLDVLTSIAISLIIILISNPFSINDIGLQLSYLGTLGIIFLNAPILNFLQRYTNKQIAEILSVTISAQIIILPIMALQFNTLSTIFIISNLLAIPMSGVIILLGYANVFIGIISIRIGELVGIFTNALLQILIWISEYTSKIPFANIIITTPSILIIIMYYIAVYWIYKKKHIKKVIIMFCTIAIITNISSINFGKLNIHFIDVAQRRQLLSKNSKRQYNTNRYRRKRKYTSRIFIR